MLPALDNDNRRHSKRFRAHHPAKIVFGPESMISCVVRDISMGGAQIAVQPHTPLPENFELFIAAHDLQVRRARVCWRRGDLAGLSFSAAEAAEERPHLQLVASREAAAQDNEAAKVRVELERDVQGRGVSLLRTSA